MPTRISGACNGCRAKKQKCSGDRSGCLQCEAAGVPCTWPEQRKRGPAKGYIEGLEHRLHEAETLLLQLLPYVSTAQLQAATTALPDNGDNDSGRGSPDRRSSPPVLNKKTGIDYWENFPLTSVTDIRRWQQDCEVHRAGHRETSVKPENRRPSASPHIHASEISTGRVQHNTQELQLPSTEPYLNDGTLNSDFYIVQNAGSSSRHILSTNQIPNQIQTQDHNNWHAQMLHTGSIARSNSHSRTPQQQLFTQASYLGNPNINTWQMQQTMNLGKNSEMGDPENPLQGTDQQVHSHLFW